MKIIVDGKEINAVYGETLLKTARRAGIYIPTLCYHEALKEQGRCRLCVVEVCEGSRKSVVAACTFPVRGEIEVKTSTPLVDKIRRNIIMLLYKRASGSPVMQKLYREYGCSQNSLKENPGERCILCNICVLACEEIGCSAISLIMRGTDKRVATPYDEAAPSCIGCGACARVCPAGAIEMTEKDGVRTIWNKSFPLAACQRCGKYFATREELDFMARNNKIFEEYSLCDECRKRVLADKIAEYTGS